MNLKSAFIRSLSYGVIFSLLFSLMGMNRSGFSLVRFVAFAALFTVLYTLFLVLLPKGGKK